MLERLEGLPAGVVGVSAVGAVSEVEYMQVIRPLVDQALREGRPLRFLYQFGPDFDHFSVNGVWEDVGSELRARRVFEGCAVVTDVPWIHQSVGLARFLVPCPVRVFPSAAFDEAAAWLESLDHEARLSHRLLPESGVLVVEPKDRLRAEDFDALARVADPWIAAHGQLRGVVIRTAAFPGWQNLSSLVRNVKFVHDHQRKVRRVALVADSKLAELMVPITEHFVGAEVRHFAYAELDEAIAWASTDQR